MHESKCKGCGADIIWAITAPAQKNMPLDAISKQMMIITGYTDSGGTPIVRFITTYMPHWATCPKAKEFKKKK